jgi:hypothetical protein
LRRNTAGAAHADPGGGPVLRCMLPTLHIRVAAEGGCAFDQHKSRRRRQMTAKPVRYSQLSPARQALVRLCQSTNYGHIQDLDVRDQEPVLTAQKCVVLTDVKLDAEERPRQEAAEPDFLLCAEIVRLMALLDKINNGKISKLEIRAGIPRRIILENVPTEFECVST